jgi:hypothetical protein
MPTFRTATRKKKPQGRETDCFFLQRSFYVEEWLTHLELHFQTRPHQPAPNAILKNTPTAINNATPELIKAADISLAMAFSSVETRPSPHIRIGGMSFNQRSFLEKL